MCEIALENAVIEVKDLVSVGKVLNNLDAEYKGLFLRIADLGL